MRWLVVLIGCAMSGCLSLGGPDCINETRSFTVTGSLARAGAPADTGTASVWLHEARNHDSKRTSAQEIMWHVRAPAVTRADVTAIHVHEIDGGRLVFSIPIDTLASPLAITTTYTGQPFPGSAIPWSQTYELVGSGKAYLDVHVAGADPRVLRANLTRPDGQGVADWRAFQHLYCS